VRSRLRARRRPPRRDRGRGLQHDRVRLEELGAGADARVKRIDEAELLDELDAPRADMERSLRDLRRINKYFGGRSIYRRLLGVFDEGCGRLVRTVRTGRPHPSIIDIGTGTSDLLEQLEGFRV